MRRLTVLSIAYPLAPVGPDSVGGSEQVLSTLDRALVAALIAQRASAWMALTPYAGFGLAPRRLEDPIDPALRPLGLARPRRPRPHHLGAGWRHCKCCGREGHAPVWLRT